MKRYWQIAAARIDEMTLRQRAMLFSVVALLVVVMAHALLLDPVLARQKALIDRVNRDQSQLNAVRAQLESILKEGGAGQTPEEAEVRVLEEKVAQAATALGDRKRGFIAPARLPVLVKGLLGPGRPFSLESLRVVPGAPVEGAELYRHGVELTLKGSYFELLQYLSELEKPPARFLWGEAELQVEKYPEVRLTIQLHTLSPQRSLGL
jgi:MSHA biogenesis protein MshJ